MRFKLQFLGLALCTVFFAEAQPVLVDGDVCLDIEVVAIHTEGALEGLTTYRLFATLPGPEDVITTVFGDAQHPTSVQTTTSFYQDEIGGQFPCANNPILFDAFPTLAWDSWLTLGVSGPPDPALGEDCPQVVMSTGSPFVTEFESGNGFTIDDMIGSAWFVVPSNTNGLPDADGRVLLAQLTTDGALSGVFYIQVLPGGVGTLAEVVGLPFYGECAEISPIQCPEEIAVDASGCDWQFEAGSFQPSDTAVWSFGDDVQVGGHYTEYSFAQDGQYPVSVTYSSAYCPEGVTLVTEVTVEGCSEVECTLELNVETAQEGEVIMVIPVDYPEGVELVYSLNGEVFQEGGLAMTLPVGTGNAPWQVCVQYVSEDCPDGVVACTGSEDYEPGCPDEIWVGGSGCEYILSICDYTEGESVEWTFSDGTSSEGHFTWHTFPEDGIYEACATYVSPTCPDTAVLCTAVEVEGCGPCPLEVVILNSATEDEGWILEAVGMPPGTVVSWLDAEGALISESVELYFSGEGTVCAVYESEDCPEGVEACIELELPEPECGVEVTITPLGECGQYLAQYEGEPGPGDVMWYLDGDLVQTGGSGFDFALDSAQVAVLCAVATGADCPEGEEVCTEVQNEGCEPCLNEDEAELMVLPLDGEAPCSVMLLLEMMQPNDFYIFWDFGDGITTTDAYLFTNHQYSESGTYEVCATVFSPGCLEGATWCIDVEVEGCDQPCEPIAVTVAPNEGASGYYFWSGYADNWAQEGVFFIPEGSADPVELGLCLADGCYVLDFWGSSDLDLASELDISVSDSEGTVAWENEPLIDENGWQVISFGVGGGCDPEPEECELEIEAAQEADGSWTLMAVTESLEDVGFVWTFSDGSVLNGATVSYAFVSGTPFETACVAAFFPECDEVLAACIDLDNGADGTCEAVEVVIEGETFVELLEDLEWAWSLFGGGFEWSDAMSLDPTDGDAGGIVLCLPPGCYALSMEMSGLPGFQGLPGMTMSLNIGAEEQVSVDLTSIEGVFDLEFGVLTDCESAIEGASVLAPTGLSVFPNPADGVAHVRLDDAAFDGKASWVLADGLGRIVLRGTAAAPLWELPLQGLPPGGYLLHVESGVHGLDQRVMVTR